MAISIRHLEKEDINGIAFAFGEAGYRSKRPSLFKYYLEQQSRGERQALVAYAGSQFAGYVTILWQADYPAFADKGIPLIQDLNVLPKFRRRGIGTALVDEAEKRIKLRSKQAGIGVGLYADYGPAQRMYVLRGYVPDGLGLFYRERPVEEGEKVPADDDLLLFLVKKL